MILEGPTIEDQSHRNTAKLKDVLSLSELIMYNCVEKCATQDSNTTRHIRDRESPIYLSLLVHAQTRTRDNIDTVHNLGLCASYDRMMSISTDMANSVCTRYQDWTWYV